jgi:hypothetical protein
MAPDLLDLLRIEPHRANRLRDLDHVPVSRGPPGEQQRVSRPDAGVHRTLERGDVDLRAAVVASEVQVRDGLVDLADEGLVALGGEPSGRGGVRGY